MRLATPSLSQRHPASGRTWEWCWEDSPKRRGPASVEPAITARFRLVGIPVFFLISDDLSRINSPADELRHISPHLLGVATEIGIHMLDWLAEEN